MMKRALLLASVILGACQGTHSGSSPNYAPNPDGAKGQMIGIDASWLRMSAGRVTPESGKTLEWIARHPRLRSMSDDARIAFVERAAALLYGREHQLGSPLAPSQLAATGGWTLPEGIELSSSAGAIVLGTTANATNDRIIIEGSDTGTDHYLAVLSNIYTGSPTVTKTADLGAPLADGTAILIASSGTDFYGLTSTGVLWSFKVSDASTNWSTTALGTANWSTPWIDFGSGNIFVNAGGQLHAINSANGAAVSGFTPTSFGTTSHNSPIVYNGIAWAGDDNGNLHRLNPSTGAEIGTPISLCNGACGANDAIWSAAFIDTDNNKLILGVNKRLIQIDLNACDAMAASCSFSALDINSPSFVTPNAVVYSTPMPDNTAGAGNHVYFAFANRLWSTTYDNGVLGSTFSVATTADPTGLLPGVSDDNGYPRGIPLVFGGNIYIGDGGGFMNRFDAATFTQTAFKNYQNPGVIQSSTAPAIDSTVVADFVGGNIYFAARNSNAPRGTWVQVDQGFATEPPPAGTTATRLRVECTAGASTGAPFNVTIAAIDASGNVSTGYTGTIHFSSTDPAAVLPANYTFTGADAGVHTFSVTLRNVGTFSITATDTATATIHGSATVTTSAPRLQLTPQFNNVAVGQKFSLKVTALDSQGNTLTSYSGLVTFSSTDANATLPASYTFTTADNGSHTFNNVVLRTVGTQTITATDYFVPSITGSVNIGVATPVLDHLQVTPAASTEPAFTNFSVTVTAVDANGTPVTNYTGTIHFTSSDANAVLPADYTFVAADNGAHTFTNGVQMKTGGSQTITATDTAAPTVTGTATITVTGGAVDHFSVVGPTSVQANQAFTVYVYAKDSNNTTITNYTGTIQFGSSDVNATLPANYTFTSSDGGFHAFFYAFKLSAGPSQTITATDTANPAISGSTSITVSGGAVTHFQVAGPTSVNAGQAFNIFVYAKDANENTVPSYRGTIHFSSNDTMAQLPADYTFTAADNGAHTFYSGGKLFRGGTDTVTVNDTLNTAVTGTMSIQVTAQTVDHFSVTTLPASTVQANTFFNVYVFAKDAMGNTVQSYTGTVHFTSSDGTATLPANYSFTATDQGIHSFLSQTKLYAPGSQSVTVTDTTTPTTTGTVNLTVTGGVVTHLNLLSSVSSVTAGTAFNLYVYGLDSNNNRVVSFTDQVHFSSTDPIATLPANYTFTSSDAGYRPFIHQAVLRSTGVRTITVSDVTTPGITSSTVSITVN